MKCLVLAPQRFGIREVAERIGQEWEEMGHDVEYRLPDGAAARIGPVTVGVVGIAEWWRKQFKELAQNPKAYDLIWTHQPISPTLPTKDPELWNRMIMTFHTTEHEGYRLAKQGIYPRKRLPYYATTRWFEGRFHKRLAALEGTNPMYTVVSSQLHDEIARFGVEDAVCIPNGVFVPEDRDFSPIRHEYGIPSDATVLFNIGRLTEQKRPAVFAETMTEVCNQRDDLYCIIAGKGRLADEVAGHTSERVKALGFVSDEEKWRWFADADVFASLSGYEGMPVATLEALSFGCPVVLSDIPAHRAVIDEYDATGRCVDVKSAAVAAAIDDVVGREADVELPTWEEIAEGYLERFNGRRSNVSAESKKLAPHR
ncbi:glycosyltransferase family 4 protein [Natronomonas halophila]|uniref:glycosyltransferase family 4 protein n=1 Tax=Natronomonas halophila TaxID=2747817 RepID=UPI0015B77AF5|nr:glycosyltransferase family 4 protein [Natronomonas halophila]QLD87080.1 glycosyltransferase family 4 protein [Natronomonas halophila]